MARKPIQKDAQAFSPPPSPQREVRRAQIDISFENQSLLAALFGQFDANLVQVENRLGVFMFELFKRGTNVNSDVTHSP